MENYESTEEAVKYLKTQIGIFSIPDYCMHYLPKNLRQYVYSLIFTKCKYVLSIYY